MLLQSLFCSSLLLAASAAFSLTVPINMGPDLAFQVNERALSEEDGATQFAVEYLDTKTSLDRAITKLDVRGFTSSSDLMVFYIKVAKLLKGTQVHQFCDELLTSESFFDRLIETQDVKKVGPNEFFNTLHLAILGIPIKDVSYKARMQTYQDQSVPQTLRTIMEDADAGIPSKVLYMEGFDNGGLLGGLTLVGKLIDKGADTLVIANSFIALKKDALGAVPRSIIKRVGPGRMRDTIFYMLGQFEQGCREEHYCQCR